jgi:hypothetical protein
VHTVIVIAVGLAVLGAALLAGHVLGGAAGMARAARYFLPVWLIGAGINMYVGVHAAGYAVRAEAPILLVVFAVPAAVALLCWCRLAPP